VRTKTTQTLGKQGGLKKAARRKFRIAIRQRAAAKMYAADHTQQKIASMLGVNQRTVSKDLNAVWQHTRARASEHIERWRDQQIERLDAERTYLMEFRSKIEVDLEQSRRTFREMRRDVTFDDKGVAQPGRTATVTSYEREGDSRLIAQILAVTDRLLNIEKERAALLGTYSPTKHTDTDLDGNPSPRVGNVLFIGMKAPHGFGSPED
jgi:hypothetical protein